MTHPWPNRDDRERWEATEFIRLYRRLRGRSFEIVTKGERPDWVLRDRHTGADVGLELTSVYLDDRSVPDVHMLPGDGAIPFDEQRLHLYEPRLVDAVAAKVRKALSGYSTTSPLILPLYANEHESIHMTPRDWEALVRRREAAFDDVRPFSEVVFWPLVNDGVFGVRPRSGS